MVESKSNLLSISENLTKTEFKGFCKGMSIHWYLKSTAKSSIDNQLYKRVRFWDSAFDKYSHNCKEDNK